ncbi:MAG: DUF4296 domain-containing protein [Bacteroidota bacterium]
MALVLLVTTIFFTACKDKKVRPKDILSKQEFIDVLCDIHISDAYTEYKGYQADTLVMTNQMNFKTVLQAHKVNQEVFMKTYNFYMQNPEDMDLVYLEVIDKLSQMQADANK